MRKRPPAGWPRTPPEVDATPDEPRVADYYRFCPVCGGKLSQELREGRRALVCGSCAYSFVLVVPGVAVAIVEDGRILLVRRRYTRTAGLWCIPQGKVELDEDLRDAARREILEETGLEVRLGELLFVSSSFAVPGRPVLAVWFAADVTGGELKAGDEVTELRYVPLEGTTPDLAFEDDKLVIEKLREDIAKD